MNIEAKLEEFAQGDAKLHFVYGVSGFIMKELQEESATVFCWDSEDSAKEFISSKFSGKQLQQYSVKKLNFAEFRALKHTIKWLPENARVELESYCLVATAT